MHIVSCVPLTNAPSQVSSTSSPTVTRPSTVPQPVIAPLPASIPPEVLDTPTGTPPPTPTDQAAETQHPTRIAFRYVWTTKISMRAVSDDESVILQVSPKFATVYEHVSFQWNLKIHGTTGKLFTSDDEADEEGESPTDYVAVELYFVDGPASQVDVRAKIGIIEHESKDDYMKPLIEERKTIRMDRGRGAEITDSDRALVSQTIKENVGRVVRISVLIKMEAKLFDPNTYLDSISPTPQKSFLTTNYNARVNSKVWKRRSRKKSQSHDNNGKMSRKEKIDYEKKFAEVMEDEREKRSDPHLKVRCSSVGRGGSSGGGSSSRRGSTQTLLEHCGQSPDHEHLFKKLLVKCCESCERRRSSVMYDSRTDTDEDEDDCSVGSSESDEEERCFECTESSKVHVHDLLANLYFNKVVLPEMEYVEDFVDFLIDAELNDLPVLKRACERYLCGELNTKKDVVTSLVLDLLFISIVFCLPVMKSMTLSELSTRTDQLSNPDKLLEMEEYKNLDKRIRSLSDRNLVELIEQCTVFTEQRNRVKTYLLNH